MVAGGSDHERAAFFAFAYPTPDGFAGANVAPTAARWDGQLGEYVLEWEDIRESPDPRASCWSSPGRRSAMPARSATGTRRWRQLQREFRRR